MESEKLITLPKFIDVPIIVKLKNISFTIEMHQSKYENPLVFEKVIYDLLDNQYSLY